MATSAFIIYTDANGELRGTEIRRMGGGAPQQLLERFDGDYEALTKFIEVGSKHGGYFLATDDEPCYPYDEDNRPVSLSNADEADYVFHVRPGLTFQPVRVKAVTTYSLEEL